MLKMLLMRMHITVKVKILRPRMTQVYMESLMAKKKHIILNK